MLIIQSPFSAETVRGQKGDRGGRNKKLSMEKDLQTQRGQEVGEGWSRSLGLVDANYYVQNG